MNVDLEIASPNSPLIVHAGQIKVYGLNLTIFEAELKRDLEFSGKMECSCMMKIKETSYETRTCADLGLSPKWNQDFEFERVEYSDILVLQILDFDKFDDEPVVRCSTAVKLSDIFKEQKSEMWIPAFKNRNEVQGKLRVGWELKAKNPKGRLGFTELRVQVAGPKFS